MMLQLIIEGGIDFLSLDTFFMLKCKSSGKPKTEKSRHNKFSMKRLNQLQVLMTAIILLSLSLSSCQNQCSEFKWTEAEKEIAKKEITETAKQVIKGARKADFQMAATPYLNSPDFFIVNPDATYNLYEGFEKNGKEFFSQLAIYDQTTIKEEYRFLNKGLVLYTWIGKAGIELKTGDKMKFESYIGTMLFQKIKGEWKITYAHETASQPIMSK